MGHYANYSNMTTDRWSGFERSRVDLGQTSFFEGREFRSFLEFSLAVGASITGRFTAPCPFILFEQLLSVDGGGVKLEAFAGGTPAGTFSTVLPVVGKNRLPERRAPYYVGQCSIDTGGTVSGGLLVDVVRLIAPGSGSNTSTVSGGEAGERGLPAGTYFIKLSNISNSPAIGTYSLWWEERARHPDWKVGNTAGG